MITYKETESKKKNAVKASLEFFLTQAAVRSPWQKKEGNGFSGVFFLNRNILVMLKYLVIKKCSSMF